MKFFSFWRSLASFRVRIALNLKNVPAEVVFVDLDANAHRDPEYRKINPQMALPALVEDDGTTLFQSLAILEYLDETHPNRRCCRPIRAAAPGARAGADGRLRGPPLLVPRVRRYLDRELICATPSRMRGAGTGPSRRWPRWKATSPATRTPAASAMAMRRGSPTSAWWDMSPSRSRSRSI